LASYVILVSLQVIISVIVLFITCTCCSLSLFLCCVLLSLALATSASASFKMTASCVATEHDAVTIALSEKESAEHLVAMGGLADFM
jgi:uncharacterized membrane protein